MGYFFEELDDEKFQKLCQAILTVSFPDAVCMPVGQPDGGRDAYMWQRAKVEKKELIVFQVKFSRDPTSKEARDVIADAIKSEGDKIEELKKRGATKYIFLTNVRGTSHLDTGSIDRVEEELSNGLSIPASCWWRDDLEARINANSDIKWSFPEITKGSDLLQFLVEQGSKEQSEDRTSAIRSYMAAQYADDEQVKFKQVGLQNELLELFVDLPARAANSTQFQPHRWLERELNAGDSVYYENAHVEADGYITSYVQRRAFALAAASLLKHPLDSSSTRIVMEGAPGQGKSTITQYICQVNRVRFLEKATLSSIPPEHLKGPLRLPFRIDLRDYASWLQAKNPFSADNTALPTNAQPALESFLAAQISHVSGGYDFSVANFSAVTRSSHVLIVLDGFDEIADISIRKRTVEEISRASARIHANAKSAQIVVTSRPSAFANSPGFPETEWQHIELQSMPIAQINAYAKKWMAARQLSPRERSEFEKLLREKLEQPHMRDLARNPMQLTILLALIHQRGLSLPDKRTALYDSYMDLFLVGKLRRAA
jgi:hypothetical protein